jgi:hypothetical protein
VTEYQRGNIRVSDTEREDALGKLGQHMSEGRLDIEEYGERTAKVATAKTRADVLALFDDLPEPRPAFGQPGPPATREPRKAQLGRQLTPVVPVLAIVLLIGLTVVLKVPFFFFMLPVIFFFAQSGRWGHHHRR